MICGEVFTKEEILKVWKISSIVNTWAYSFEMTDFDFLVSDFSIKCSRIVKIEDNQTFPLEIMNFTSPGQTFVVPVLGPVPET